MTMIRRTILAACAALALSACNSGPQASDPATSGVTDAMLETAPAEEWLTYGRDYGEQRFSPLNAINAENVSGLGLAWSADIDTARGQEATPLMHDGVLYVSTAWSKVNAYDARTGELKWSYDPEVPRETLAVACCDAVNRGVALYGDKVYVATLNGDLVALNQADGTVAWRTTVVPDTDNYTITGAPRVANGKILIGSGGAEYKARGFIAAYDWATGEELWRFHTVPGNPADGFENDAMELAAATWGGEWWELGGGGTVWDAITFDPATNLVLFGTGNAEPWNPGANGRGSVEGHEGAGDNLYTSSIVAVDADTGEYKWHFQETPEDRWDYDSNAQITVTTMMIDGAERRVAVHVPKNGYVYVLDVATGEFLSGTPWTPQNWTLGIDPETGRPQINPAARYEQTGELWVSVPGAAGAHSWQPMSYSQASGLVYIPANNGGFPFVADNAFEASDIGFQTGLNSAATAMPADPAARQAAKDATTGALIAWNVAEGREAWRVNYTGPWNGGTLATAGNLVFQGTADERFIAYTADTGRQLWSFATQSGVIAAPMTYSIDGEQYVAIMVGWGGVWDIAPGALTDISGTPRNISRLLVFKLGADGTLAAPPALAERALDPPPVTGTPEQIAAGALTYGRYCGICHGDAAIAGALNPDLRHSGAINQAESMKSIVLDGAFAHNGMVSFASALDAAKVENVRHYIISRANEDLALERR
jgi:quinohemoprotein ethanol dehydrogenase